MHPNVSYFGLKTYRMQELSIKVKGLMDVVVFDSNFNGSCLRLQSHNPLRFATLHLAIRDGEKGTLVVKQEVCL